MAKKKTARKFENAAILFFDVKNYSKLDLDELDAFHNHVMPSLYKIVAGDKGERRSEYEYMNTWGDGIILVHNDCRELTLVGLNLRDYFRKEVNYRRIKLEKGEQDIRLKKVTLLSRIAIHFGYFAKCTDSFQNRPNVCFGPTIVLPARIEPITPPGRVWVTKRVVDMVKDHEIQAPGVNMAFDKRGKQELVKAYGKEDIYEARFSNEKKKPWRNPEGEAEDIQKALPKGGIDKATLHKIKRVIGVDAENQRLQNCYQDTSRLCEFQLRSLCLPCDMVRVSDSTKELLDVLRRLPKLRSICQHFVSKNDKKNLEDADFRKFEHNISEFLNVFSKFDRQYPKGQRWTTKRKLAERAVEFLKRRYNDGEDGKKIKRFIDALVDIHLRIRKNEIEISDYGHLNPTDLANPLLSIVDDANELMVGLERELPKLVDTHLMGNHKALSVGFKRFKRAKLAEHMVKTINELPHNSGEMCPLWPQ